MRIHSDAAKSVPPPIIINPDTYLYGADGKYRFDPEVFDRAVEASTARYEQALASGRVTKAVLVVGIPGSGKSTYCARNAQPGAVYFDEAQLMTPAARKPYIDMAKRHGVPVEIVWLDTPLSTCIARNRARPKDRQVPEHLVVEWFGTIQRQAPRGIENGARVIRIADP